MATRVRFSPAIRLNRPASFAASCEFTWSNSSSSVMGFSSPVKWTTVGYRGLLLYRQRERDILIYSKAPWATSAQRVDMPNPCPYARKPEVATSVRFSRRREGSPCSAPLPATSRQTPPERPISLVMKGSPVLVRASALSISAREYVEKEARRSRVRRPVKLTVFTSDAVYLLVVVGRVEKDAIGGDERL